MEDNTNVTQQEEVVEEVKVEEEPKEAPEKAEPSVQDLMTEIARLKRQADKASSEAAEYKKKWKCF